MHDGDLILGLHWEGHIIKWINRPNGFIIFTIYISVQFTFYQNIAISGECKNKQLIGHGTRGFVVNSYTEKVYEKSNMDFL